jgi:membrane protein implicated in regulation of membrane protease activity
MEIQIWWIWLALAAIFVIGEIFTEGFFLFCFAVGAAVAGVLALLGLGAAWQWGAFVVISGILFMIARRFAERLSKKQPPGIGADRWIGESGTVLETIDNARSTGVVRLGKEEWKAESESAEIIQEGEVVEVVRMEGTHLIVKPRNERSMT